ALLSNAIGSRWQKKKPSASLRRFGAASLLAASVSSVSRRGGGVDGNASMSTSRAQSPTSAGPRTLNPFQRASPPKPASPTTNEETSKTVILLDDTLTMELFGVVDDGSLASPTHGSSVSPDGVVGGGAPLNSSRMHHMQAVQAKLDRSREAHVKAEEKRQAIHDAAKEATRGVRVLGVSDLESVDKRNYLHPDADKRADLAARVQKHKQRGFTTYLSRVPFSTGAV
ncbi:Hypothetical protein, putative, partial [Bodo saltans]